MRRLGGAKIRVQFGPTVLCSGAIEIGFTFRFREWLRRSDQGLKKSSGPTQAPARQGGHTFRQRMSARAATRRARGGEAMRGGSFPMAMTGTVKFFNGERGYGFIKPDDGGRDVFVHITAVERAGLKDLTEGQRITFEVEPDKKGKGPKAVNLVVQP
jgi:CspA family cold shock protein